MADNIVEKKVLLKKIRKGKGNTNRNLREFITSMSPPYGSIYRNGSIEETSVGSAGTYVKANINTSLVNSSLMESTINNRLEYIGSVRKFFRIICSISMTSTLNPVIASFKLVKGRIDSPGLTFLDETVVRKQITTDIDSLVLHAECIMNKNDYIELWLANETDMTSIIIEEIHLSAIGNFI
jgi:hypothetical protein